MNSNLVLFLFGLFLLSFISCKEQVEENLIDYDRESEFFRFLKLYKQEEKTDTILLLPTNICLTCNLPFQFVVDTIPNLTILVGSGLEKHVHIKDESQKLILFDPEKLPRYGLLKYYPELFIVEEEKIVGYYPIINKESLNSFWAGGNSKF